MGLGGSLLRVRALDATAGGPSSLLKNATGVSPFTLLTEEVGRGLDAGGGMNRNSGDVNRNVGDSRPQ